MSSLAKKIRRQQGIRIFGHGLQQNFSLRCDIDAMGRPNAVKLPEHQRKAANQYARAASMEFTATEQAKGALDSIIDVTRIYAGAYTIYVLDKYFHVSHQKIEAIADKVQTFNKCIQREDIDFAGIVNDVIRSMDKDGCKFPDYVPAHQRFPRNRLMDQRRAAGRTLQQAMADVKKLEYAEIMYTELEILILISLHDVLGYSRKRLKRFLEEFHKVRHGGLSTFREVVTELTRKKYYSDDDITWKLLKKLEARSKK